MMVLGCLSFSKEPPGSEKLQTILFLSVNVKVSCNVLSRWAQHIQSSPESSSGFPSGSPVLLFNLADLEEWIAA